MGGLGDREAGWTGMSGLEGVPDRTASGGETTRGTTEKSRCGVNNNWLSGTRAHFRRDHDAERHRQRLHH